MNGGLTSIWEYQTETVIVEASRNRGIHRADFRVRDIFIEYFGLAGHKGYDEKAILKKKLCEDNGIKLILLYQRDILTQRTLKRSLTSDITYPSASSLHPLSGGAFS